MRLASIVLLAAGLTFAQEPWQAATDLPGLDFTGLTAAQKTSALKLLRQSGCACGCAMKMAECRVKDPACGVSRSLSNLVIKGLKAGKNIDLVAKELAEEAKKGPTPLPLLEEPISISIMGDPVKGPVNAKITIVEFSDFQCPYCAAAAAKVNELMAQYPNDIRLVFKQFPLDIHSQAGLAAQASLAAAAQGKFWEMHDKMFTNFRQINRDRINQWARELGLNKEKFNADIDGAAIKSAVTKELQEGVNAGVSGTPTFFINGKKFNGPMEGDVIKPIFEKELGR